jgi:hypothetical protein
MTLTTNKWGIEKRVYAAYKPKPLPDALKPSVKLLARSRGWSQLKSSTQKLAMVVLGKIKPGDNPVLETTQEELRSLAGIGSRHTSKYAVQELRDIGLITTQREVAPAHHQPLSHYTTRMILRLEWASNMFQDWLQGRTGYWLWFYRPFIRITGYLQHSIDVQSLHVQNRVLIHENAQPKAHETAQPNLVNPSPGTQGQVDRNGYTDKEFAGTLFGMLDERGWLGRGRDATDEACR